MCVHVITYVRLGLVRVGTHVPGISIVTITVRSVVRWFRIA